MPMNSYQSAVPSDLSGSLVPFRFGTLAACHLAPLRKACSFIGIPSRGMIPYSGRETALLEKWTVGERIAPVGSTSSISETTRSLVTLRALVNYDSYDVGGSHCKPAFRGRMIPSKLSPLACSDNKPGAVAAVIYTSKPTMPS